MKYLTWKYGIKENIATQLAKDGIISSCYDFYLEVYFFYAEQYNFYLENKFTAPVSKAIEDVCFHYQINRSTFYRIKKFLFRDN